MNEEVKQVIYKKTCLYCGQPYESTVRHQRYCCKACADKAQKRQSVVKKNRAKRRNASKENKAERLILSAAYTTCQRMADLFIPPVSYMGGDPRDEKQGPLQLHHLNMLPWDNRPENLVRLTNSEHAELHGWLPDINFEKLLKRAREEQVSPTEMFRVMLAEYKVDDTEERWTPLLVVLRSQAFIDRKIEPGWRKPKREVS